MYSKNVLTKLLRCIHKKTVCIPTAGTLVMGCVLVPIMVLLLFIALINVLQNKRPSFLPPFLRDWAFLPLPLRSLEPYDRLMLAAPCCASCRDAPEEPQNPSGVVVVSNEGEKRDHQMVALSTKPREEENKEVYDNKAMSLEL